ncbi:MAG: hypothetical protein AAF226_11835, partial [Verrucomicrobiota bacterium]
MKSRITTLAQPSKRSIPFTIMKSLLTLFTLITLAITVGSANDAPMAGHWNAMETMLDDNGQQIIEWHYQLMIDGDGTVAAVGERYRVNGNRVTDPSMAIFVLNQQGQEVYGGYIESYGDGDQYKMDL